MVFGRSKDASKRQEATEEQAVELDEEGQVEISPGAGGGYDYDDRDDGGSDDRDEDDGDEDGGDDGVEDRAGTSPSADEEHSEAPPPPPPPPPSADKGGGAGGGGIVAGRKKRIALAAAGLGLVAVGLGLGLGLTRNDDNNGDENGDGGGNSSGARGSGEVAAADAGGGGNGTVTGATPAADVLDEGGTAPTAGEEEERAATTTEAPADVAVAADSPEADEAATDGEAGGEADATTPPYAEYVDYGAPFATTEAPPARQNYDAVIVGAGWAGIRAAETLLSRGVENVMILEAADHVGGRARSVNLDGSINDPSKVGDASNVPYDLGCEWLYDNGNAMEARLVERGYMAPALANDRYTAVPMQRGAFYRQTRDEDTGELSAERIEDSDEWIEETWHKGFLQFREEQWDNLEGWSYADAIDQYIEADGWTDDEYLQFFNLVEDVIETEYTADASDLDLHEVEFFPRGYTVRSHYASLPGMGFGNIAADYAESFRDKIRLGARVTEINSEGFNGGNGHDTVVRYVEDGEAREVNARTVLVTVSLGVLKAGSIDFVPSLPAWKQESIDEMGFGIVDKCIMSWDDDDSLVWPRDELWFLLTTPDDATSGRWTQFYNPSEFKGGRPSLTAWVGGDDAPEAEAQTDEAIVAHVMRNLRSMFPDARDPDRTTVTRWGKDENVRGTYSFPVPGRDFYDDAGNLARRIGKIWFAGEATGKGWATTVGAWDTGEAQALNMVESLEDV